jgi:ribonuclease Z
MVFKVIILGSNSAIPTLRRNPTSQLVNHNERFFLVDCAEGTQLQLRRYRIRMQRIHRILISHLHGDHFFGLIGLISSMHLLGRKKDLHIYAPAELEQILKLQLEVSQTELNYRMEFHPVNPEEHTIVYEDEKLEIHTIPLNHRIPTCGYLFKEKQGRRRLIKQKIKELNIPVHQLNTIKNGADYTDESGRIYKNEVLTVEPAIPRSYAYCSDTSYFEPVIPIIQNADLLYHEATFMEDKADAARDKYHSTAIEAATIAQKAGVKKLIIGHFSTRYDHLEPLLEEARSVFPDTHTATDGNLFDV